MPPQVIFRPTCVLRGVRAALRARSFHHSLRGYASLKTPPSAGYYKPSGRSITLGVLLALLAVAAVGSYTVVASDSKRAPSAGKGITVEELQAHTTRQSCWVVINGQVYDLTEMLNKHPGGAGIILRYAGKDASKKFNPLHAPDLVDKLLPADKHLGPLIGELPEAEELLSEEEEERAVRREQIPPLSQMYNLQDFEHVAKEVLPLAAWAYYSSGADDEISLRENHNGYGRIFFRPRVCVDVSTVDPSTTMLGETSPVPFYITATALAKLGHPEGEVGIARGAGSEGVIQMISTLASCSFKDITAAAVKGQLQWFQLYLNPDRDVSRAMVKACDETESIKAIFLTVDAPQLGRREKDMRLKFEENADAIAQTDMEEKVDRSQGAAHAISSFIDRSITWKDVTELKSLTTLPIVVKGIQRYEDVIIAAESGADAVVLSNHGGRQLDYAQSPIEVLAETMPELRRRNLSIEVYIDGGVRRGSDIIKALCLGAKGVGLGRPFLYANSVYGEAGVAKAIQLLKEELELNMRLLGVTRVEDLDESYVDLKGLHSRTLPRDNLYYDSYENLAPAKFRDE